MSGSTSIPAHSAVPVVSLALWVLFGVACWLPALDLGPGDSGAGRGVTTGWGLLRLGCSEISPTVFNPTTGVPPGAVAWLANPLLLIGWLLLLCRLPRVALAAGLGAALAALTVWLNYSAVDVLEGYYLWLASTCVLAGGGWLEWQRQEGSGPTLVEWVFVGVVPLALVVAGFVSPRLQSHEVRIEVLGPPGVELVVRLNADGKEDTLQGIIRRDVASLKARKLSYTIENVGNQGALRVQVFIDGKQSHMVVAYPGYPVVRGTVAGERVSQQAERKGEP
jgi:hypothetical protein